MHDNLIHGANWIKDWWHVIAGLSLALWYGVIRFKKQVFASYPTHDEMNAKLDACKNEIVAAQQVTNDQTRKQHKDLRDHMDDRFDKLVDMFVGHLDRPVHAVKSDKLSKRQG